MPKRWELCIFVKCFDYIFQSNIGSCRIKIVCNLFLMFPKLHHGWVMNPPYFMLELYQNCKTSLDTLKQSAFMQFYSICVTFMFIYFKCQSYKQPPLPIPKKWPLMRYWMSLKTICWRKDPYKWLPVNM